MSIDITPANIVAALGALFTLLLIAALMRAGRDAYLLWKAEKAVERFGR